MLIDATHPEETRVVVTRGSRVEEFDYKSASRKQLRGNIYLAKVARIEPSLQAAFVNYGGNRHGFLAFAEIHSDYYQIPVAVREALMKEEAADRRSRFQDHDNGGFKDPELKEPQSEKEGAESAASPTEPALDLDASTSSGAGEEQAPLEESVVDAEQSGGSQAAVDVSEAPAPVEETKAEEAIRPETQQEEAHLESDQGEEESSGRTAPIALQAILPPTIYEEFSAAVARAEEARDEIPAHPDDVEEAAPVLAPEGDGGTQAAQKPHFASEDDHHTHWENGGVSGEGDIISVPRIADPCSGGGCRLRGCSGRVASAAQEALAAL